MVRQYKFSICAKIDQPTQKREGGLCRALDCYLGKVMTLNKCRGGDNNEPPRTQISIDPSGKQDLCSVVSAL